MNDSKYKIDDDAYEFVGDFKIDSHPAAPKLAFTEAQKSFIESISDSSEKVVGVLLNETPTTEEIKSPLEEYNVPVRWETLQVRFHEPPTPVDRAPKSVISVIDEDWLSSTYMENREPSELGSMAELKRRPKEIQEHFDAGWNLLDTHIFQLVKHNFMKGRVILKVPIETNIEYTFLGMKSNSPNRHIYVSFKDAIGRPRTEYLDMEQHDIVYKYINQTARKITASEMKSTLVRKPWQKTT